MCISPSHIGNGIYVGCRKCWQCRSNRVSDWVGRNIAETKKAVRSYAVTLTYGRSKDGVANHLRSVMLVYSDIQKMLKRMRRRGMNVRFMMAGEYGSTYSRAHWHGVFHFGKGVMPEEWEGPHLNWSAEQWDKVGGIHVPEWYEPDGRPTGFVHIKRAEYAHMRYMLKYMLKDQWDENQQLKFTMSKKPPLGAAYFIELAQETAEAGLSPRDLKYKMDVIKYNGERAVQEFMLGGRMAEIYLDTFVRHWRDLHGTKRWPESEVADGWARFGRLGKSENLTPKVMEDAEAQEKFERLLARQMAGPTLAQYFASRGKTDMEILDGARRHFAEEERTYYGQRFEPRQGRQIEFNERCILQFIQDEYGLNEDQLFQRPFDEVERIWTYAEGGYRADLRL